MAVLENVFSWSKSRDEEFRECRRKYFYDRYASWGGWDRNAPEEARQAYILKNLKNRWAWKGETVHHVIEYALKLLREGRALPFESALERLTDIMRNDYRASKQGKYRENPKLHTGLFEHEYQKEISDPVWKDIHASSVDCLRNFYNSALYRQIVEDDKKEWLAVEDLEEFDFEGARIFVKLDFARRKNGRIEIYDWKTGKSVNSQGVSAQIGTYALYAMSKWKVPAEDIRAFLFGLSAPSPVPEERAIDAALLENTRALITSSVAEMKKLLSDPAKNVPLAREHFSFTENPRICATCNFYKICEKYKNG